MKRNTRHCMKVFLPNMKEHWINHSSGKMGNYNRDVGLQIRTLRSDLYIHVLLANLNGRKGDLYP